MPLPLLCAGAGQTGGELSSLLEYMHCQAELAETAGLVGEPCDRVPVSVNLH